MKGEGRLPDTELSRVEDVIRARRNESSPPLVSSPPAAPSGAGPDHVTGPALCGEGA